MQKQTKDLLAKIEKMPKQTSKEILITYDEKKLNMWSARACRFFGFHYIHTGKVWLWLLYVVSCFLYIWFVRYIIQAFMLKQEIEKKNYEILEKLYLLYR